MMTKFRGSGIALAMMATMTAGAAMAQDMTPAAAGPADDRSLVSVAVVAGTLGIGPQIGLRLSDHFGVRGNATFLGVSGDYDSDDVTYDGKIKLKSFGAMLDVYPMGGHFRLSGGARINRNRVRLDATPIGNVQIGDATYTPTQIGTLRGRAEVKDFAPALTLGWSGSSAKGFMVGFDAGVLFQGSVKVREFTASGAAAGNATFRADLERERRELQDDVDDYKVYPIVEVSIGYRF